MKKSKLSRFSLIVGSAILFAGTVMLELQLLSAVQFENWFIAWFPFIISAGALLMCNYFIDKNPGKWYEIKDFTNGTKFQVVCLNVPAAPMSVLNVEGFGHCCVKLEADLFKESPNQIQWFMIYNGSVMSVNNL